MIKKWALVESQLRSALGLARPLLSDGDARQISEFLDHNELGLALEGLVSSLVDSAATELPGNTLLHLQCAKDEMKVTPASWETFTARFG